MAFPLILQWDLVFQDTWTFIKYPGLLSKFRLRDVETATECFMSIAIPSPAFFQASPERLRKASFRGFHYSRMTHCPLEETLGEYVRVTITFLPALAHEIWTMPYTALDKKG